MARRENQSLGGNVARIAREHDVPVESIAKATDMTVAGARAFLNGERDVTFGQLVAVGGLLRVSPSVLLEGVSA